MATAVPPTTTTPQTTLAGTADEAKRQVLAIGAQSGDQGVQAYQQAQDAIRQNNAAALAGVAHDAGLINAGAGAQASLAGYLQGPTNLELNQLSGAQANYRTAHDTEQQGTLNYLTKLGALEPMLDKFIAARAAASSGGGSGGGGGGRGGGGGGGDLTNAELKTQLVGAATQQKQSDIQQATAALQGLAQQRQQASATYLAAKHRADLARQKGTPVAIPSGKPAKGGAQLGARSLIGVASNPAAMARLQARWAKSNGGHAPTNEVLPTTLGGWQIGGAQPIQLQTSRFARGLARIAGAPTQVVAGGNPRAAALRLLATDTSAPLNALRQSSVDARQSYADALATRNEPLADLARQLGVDAGVDPNRVFGVISDSADNTLRNAEAGLSKKGGGTIGAMGNPPSLDRAIAAKSVGVPQSRIVALRSSPEYGTLAGAARQAITKGTSYQAFSDALDSWRTPQKKNGKIVSKGYPNLVKLILLDYGPAFSA